MSRITENFSANADFFFLQEKQVESFSETI